MNYTWVRADQVRVGMIVYRPITDTAIVRIEEAGHLHVLLQYADGSRYAVQRNDTVMVQVCHRRYYERSTHHRAIYASVDDVRRALG